MPRLILLATLIFCAPLTLHADIYQYADETGTVYFTNMQIPGAVRVMREETAAAFPLAEAPRRTEGYSANIRSIVENKASRYRLDPQLLMEVIRAESDFNPYAVSPKGARGLMQLMPGTASRLGVRDSFDPEQNIDGGTRYLRYLLDYFGGSVPLALAAYNAGEGAVTRWQSIPPYKETQHYVKKIMKNYGQPYFERSPEVVRTAVKRTSPSKKYRKDEIPPIRQVVAEDGSIVFTNMPETYIR